MMKRIWYIDGTYIDVLPQRAWEYENDPDYDWTESISSADGESGACSLGLVELENRGGA